VFLEQNDDSFTRKDYLKYHNTLSTATGSRDLKYGVELGLINKTGDKKTTRYEKNITNH